MTDGKKPAFLVIGAQRAATTWLHNCLIRHAELYLPEEKEVHFFDENYRNGWAWYERSFAGASPGQVLGEITPNYLDVPEAADRIKRDLPDVKLICILREPVSRARSSYQLLQDRFPGKSFYEACSEGSYLVELGLYAKHLQRYYERFDRNQILTVLYDDVRQSPSSVLHSVCRFIGIKEIELADGVSSQTNSVVFPRAQAVLRQLGLSWAVSIAKRTPMEGLARSVAKRLRSQRKSAQKDAKLKELFREDVLSLSKMIDRDLSHWL